MPARLPLPGFVNAHSHAFQRALRGKTEGGDFWAWRESMLDLAGGLTPGHVRESYVGDLPRDARGRVYGRGRVPLRRARRGARGRRGRARGGDRARAPALRLRPRRDRPLSPGVGRRVPRPGGGARRRAGARVGLAPHSVRACPREWLEEIGAYAEREGLVLHVHADEQPREIEECLAEHGLRPVELLAETGCLGPRTTIVHGTHADERELDLLAEAGARVCLCPTTEANLGDGFPPLEGLLARGIPLCIGSDSNVRIDPLEELREIEGIARRQQLRRNVIAVDRLLELGAARRRRRSGLDEWPAVEVDLDHPSLLGVDRGDVPAALVHGCAADVLAG